MVEFIKGLKIEVMRAEGANFGLANKPLEVFRREIGLFKIK
jgi:hypothetical protein